MCMIVSCLVAIIVIIILSLTGNDNGKFTGVPKDFIEEETEWIKEEAGNLMDSSENSGNTGDTTTTGANRFLAFGIQNILNKFSS